MFEYGEGVIHKKFNQFGVTLRDMTTVNAKHARLGGQELLITTKNANNGFGTTQITFNIAVIPEQWVTKINNLRIPLSSTVSPTIVIEKEVVKIPCKYCGALMDVFRNNTCSQCGAPAR